MIKETAKQIEERFSQVDIKIPINEIESRLDKLLNEFNVPAEEARRSVVNYFLKEYNIPREDFFPKRSETPTVKVSEITTDGEWIDIKANVLQLWDNTHESIDQAGLAGDETGAIKFIKWVNAELPELVEGKSYLFKNVVVHSYKERLQIDFNKTSQIEEVQDNIETPILKVSDITSDGQWMDIRAKVAQLWDNTHESIDQVGLVGDETGTIKFTKWADSELPELVEGKSYLFKNVTIKTFNEQFQIDFNKTSQIEEVQENIETSILKVNDITSDGKWMDIRAKVAQLWDNTHESIDQVGLVGDETGTIKFTKWADSELPELVEGKSYLFKNVAIKTFNERFQIDFNKTSQIEEIQEDIEIGTVDVEFEGAMVDIQAGSGLIKRCTECNRALIKGVCGEHGKVEGTYDLRIKAVIDDGLIVQDALINREVTEQLTGITLDEAKQIATQELNQEVVLERMTEKLLGKYYLINGPRLDRYILVEKISPLPPMEEGKVDALLVELEA